MGLEHGEQHASPAQSKQQDERPMDDKRKFLVLSLKIFERPDNLLKGFLKEIETNFEGFCLVKP